VGGVVVVAQAVKRIEMKRRRRMDLSHSKKKAPAVSAAGARGSSMINNVTAG